MNDDTKSAKELEELDRLGKFNGPFYISEYQAKKAIDEWGRLPTGWHKSPLFPKFSKNDKRFV